MNTNNLTVIYSKEFGINQGDLCTPYWSKQTDWQKSWMPTFEVAWVPKVFSPFFLYGTADNCRAQHYEPKLLKKHLQNKTKQNKTKQNKTKQIIR